MRYIVFSLIGLLLSTSLYVNAKESLLADTAFKQLQSLAGTWHRKGQTNTRFEIQFESIANNSVLVETWYSRGNKRSMTLYHLDGDNLMATHYCPQRNQVRMLLTPESNLSKLSFAFSDATNLINQSQSHQHTLAFSFATDPNQITRDESYLENKQLKPSNLTLVRQ